MQDAKVKAPVTSCSSDEGINPNTTKGIDMSNSPTHPPTVNEEHHYSAQTAEGNRRELAEFGFTEPTFTEEAYAQKSSDYSLRTIYADQPKIHYKGEYRFYGRITVVPSKHEFILNVFEGATIIDYGKLEAYVQKIKDGFRNSIPWQEKVCPKYGYPFFQVILGDTSPVNNELIYPCREQHCEEYGGHHLVDHLDPDALPTHFGDIIRGRNYYIQLISEKPGEWLLDTEVWRALTVTEASSYASVLMWAAAEAKKLKNLFGS